MKEREVWGMRSKGCVWGGGVRYDERKMSVEKS